MIQIGDISVLSELTDRVVIPSLVVKELRNQKAPAVVRTWAKALPSWVEVKLVEVESRLTSKEILPADIEAIALAHELGSLLLMDDQRARKVAQRSGVVTIGTVGILEIAAAKDLLSLPDAFERLRETNIFVAEDLLKVALARDSDRRAP